MLCPRCRRENDTEYNFCIFCGSPLKSVGNRRKEDYYMQNEIKAILFDIYGTLFDQDLAQRKIVEWIVQSYPEDFGSIDMAEIVQAFSDSYRSMAGDFQNRQVTESLRLKRSSLFLHMLGLSDSLAGVISQVIARNTVEVEASVEGVMHVLKEFKGRMPIAAISNGPSALQRQRLVAMGISDMFSRIILSEEVGFRKPDPAIFYYAAGTLGVKPNNCLHIGDSYTDDVIGAKSAGMMACWFNPKRRSLPENSEARPDFIISQLTDILQIINNDN